MKVLSLGLHMPKSLRRVQAALLLGGRPGTPYFHRAGYVQSSYRTRDYEIKSDEGAVMGQYGRGQHWPSIPSSSLSSLAEGISDMLQPILPYSPGELGRESTPRVSVDINQMQGGRQEILSK